jgi:membrane protein DedA with SNARE-associated domain
MTNLVDHLIQILGSVPAFLVYVIAAVWMGLESAGIGVPIEPMMLFVGSLAAGVHPHIFLPLAILRLGASHSHGLPMLLGKERARRLLPE